MTSVIWLIKKCDDDAEKKGKPSYDSIIKKQEVTELACFQYFLPALLHGTRYMPNLPLVPSPFLHTLSGKLSDTFHNR